MGPTRDTVRGEWTKLHNEKLNVLYPLLSSVRVIKLSRTRWAVHVAHMGARICLVGKPEGKKHLDDQA